MEHEGSRLTFLYSACNSYCDRWRGTRNETGRDLQSPTWWLNSIPRLHLSRLQQIVTQANLASKFMRWGALSPFR
jgi:hypothetical protein